VKPRKREGGGEVRRQVDRLHYQIARIALDGAWQRHSWRQDFHLADLRENTARWKSRRHENPIALQSSLAGVKSGRRRIGPLWGIARIDAVNNEYLLTSQRQFL
jgi:hypothetical protein